MRARAAISDGRGETLLELIIAIMIMGVLVVAVGSGIAVSAKVSGLHRMQSEAGAFLHDYAESMQGTYAQCGSVATPTYSSVADSYVAAALQPFTVAGLTGRPNGFATPAASIKFW